MSVQAERKRVPAAPSGGSLPRALPPNNRAPARGLNAVLTSPASLSSPPHHSTGQRKNYAFITFDSEDSLMRAVSEMVE